MIKLIRQNQNIIMISLGLFLVSLTALMFLLNNGEKADQKDLKADVISSTHSTETTAEKKYRELANNNNDPLLVLRIDGTIAYASPDFLALTGLSEEKIQDKLFYSLLNPEDLTTFLEAFGKTLSSEEPVPMIGPYRIRDAHGEYSINMGSLLPVKKGDKVDNLILTTKDISADVGNKYPAKDESANVESDPPVEAESAAVKADDAQVEAGQENTEVKSALFDLGVEEDVTAQTEEVIASPAKDSGQKTRIYKKTKNLGKPAGQTGAPTGAEATAQPQESYAAKRAKLMKKLNSEAESFLKTEHQLKTDEETGALKLLLEQKVQSVEAGLKKDILQKPENTKKDHQRLVFLN